MERLRKRTMKEETMQRAGHGNNWDHKEKFLLNEENEIPQDQDPQQIHERFRKYVTDVQEGGFVSERSKALQNHESAIQDASRVCQ